MNIAPPPSKNWGPVKALFTESLVGGSTPQQKGGGVHTMFKVGFVEGVLVVYFGYLDNWKNC